MIPGGRGLGAADVARHATMLENRVRKNLRRLRGGFEREGVGAFRVYDWDIPEVRVVVDWYEGHLVVAEYERDQTRALDDYAGEMALAAAAGAGVPAAQAHARRRRTRPSEGERYGRQGQGGERIAVREGDLRFWVNLTDYLDTGLFAHHRITRAMVRAESDEAELLNLFGYTGAFTCAAVAGGARESLTVDASGRYLEWADDNLALNGAGVGGAHTLVKADCREQLERLARSDRRFTLCVVDPPSFSDRGGEWDVQRDHPALLTDALAVMAPGGVLWFATNHARFEPRLEGLPVAAMKELTDETTPIDFRRSPHRVWRMVVA